ncbi:MAG: ATPase, T2SS/T4P/T4SS family [Patescibacteria group bacterium]|nr:ATPase, T2SS/T4P/T4SS family [Patescibacteria group bacterium]
MLAKSILENILKNNFSIDEKKLKQYTKEAKEKKISLEEYLTVENIVSEENLYKQVSQDSQIEYIELKGRETNPEILKIIPEEFAHEHQIVSFQKTENELDVAMLDPNDIQTIEFLRRKTGLSPKVYIATPSAIKDTLRKYHANIENDEVIMQLNDEINANTNPKDLKKIAEELPIINIVNSILEHAVLEGASDIHIEPIEKEVLVRYRIDGILKQVMSLPKLVQNGITARIKILSELKIDEHMLPQDGRFKIKLNDEKLSFRVSVMPVYDGEKIVMRLLHEGQRALSLENLGFLPKIQKLVEESIDKPHGMILVTGPTGSGKTTTLYSVLGILNKPTVNICTIEDPIEYHVAGINQSQINPKAGFTFASGLRAFLRQDPDVIMVGEIRDKETAEVAIHAAMTGHLVLSTLHTNDAPTTLPRLVDMDIPPFLVGFTTNIIIAQRLVRKICSSCKKEYKLSAEEIKELEKMLNKKSIKDLLKEQDIEDPDLQKNISEMTFYRGEGCTKCGTTGYKGRLGIYEVLVVDDDLTKLINERATAQDIKNFAEKNGMVNLFEDGLIKAKSGVTTLEEVLRVTKE